MRNSNLVFSTLVTLVLLLSTVFTTVKAQYENPEEVISVSQGYSLKVKHALSVMMTMQSQGSLSQNPTSQEIEAVLFYLVQAFESDPKTTLAQIEIGSNDQQHSTSPSGELQTQPAGHQQHSGNGVYNQQQAEEQIALNYKRSFPNAVIDYEHPTAKQVKASIGGTLMVNNDSKTYNSGSGDNYFGMTTASTLNFHFCPNGVMIMQSSSRSMGGGHGSTIDSGDSGNVVTGWWSVAMVNNQLCIMTGDQQGVDALPLFIENDSVIISQKRFTVHLGQAQCGM